MEYHFNSMACTLITWRKNFDVTHHVIINTTILNFIFCFRWLKVDIMYLRREKLDNSSNNYERQLHFIVYLQKVSNITIIIEKKWQFNESNQLIIPSSVKVGFNRDLLDVLYHYLYLYFHFVRIHLFNVKIICCVTTSICFIFRWDF